MVVGHGQEQIKTLEDDHIEQMIQELLHYGSIELCSVPTPTFAIPPPPPHFSIDTHSLPPNSS